MRASSCAATSYAHSIPALDDLRGCLERTHQHGELVHEFRQALLSRLLQPGANTSEILDIYVSTIKVRRVHAVAAADVGQDASDGTIVNLSVLCV